MAEPVEPGSIEPGQPLLRRYRRGSATSWLQACRVVAADARGLYCWLPVGAGFASRQRPDGSLVRAAPTEEFAAAELRTGSWQGRSVLIWMPAGRAHSVWWFFTGGEFSGWYVNLEDRSEFWRHGDWYGVDLTDHELDVVVAPDRVWQWKDEAELDAVTGLPGYWDARRSAGIREEARRVVVDVEEGRFPFDGSCRDFRPDPDWPIPRLPEPLPDFYWPSPGGASR
ncbi:DUF402 domain-containing protein [Jatrophihabitans sp.]|uniref:DUF402 domain-containing protein n=1 Tax=Jatrophihabitans sp. TaxID=1932789 RepID=UPI002B54A00B|nr:DUF402 domain-containing protein [Jatrophihabitans sp.]